MKKKDRVVKGKKRKPRRLSFWELRDENVELWATIGRMKAERRGAEERARLNARREWRHELKKGKPAFAEFKALFEKCFPYEREIEGMPDHERWRMVLLIVELKSLWKSLHRVLNEQENERFVL